MSLERELLKYAKHLPDCRIGSRAGYQPQARFGAACSCGLSELQDRIRERERYSSRSPYDLSRRTPEQGGSEK
jgi:hypothetical protein